MCGFAGLIHPGGAPEDRLGAEARAMIAPIVHRGPDAVGTWTESASGVALGHRRLAILDLSERGHQPMVSASGRWVLVYNGEIYDHRDLRGELEARGHHFTGTSDTETLLAAIDAWGPRGALERCNGMFALAAWDRREARLVLARDRVGKKPLYYGWRGATFVFGSELSAIRALSGAPLEIDRESLASYLRYKATPGTRSVYRGIHKLEPGAIRTLAPSVTRDLTLERYWSAADVVATRTLRSRPDDVLDEELDALLTDAVRIRMESDVPLGAFLSGGVDSSLVVAAMQALSTDAVRTFSIGFDVDGWDEAPHAAAVARHLGTAHTELYVTPEDARAVIPELPGIFDEPFADVSQIPMYLVAKLAKRHVTVALSGDGGDELFAGYPRYSFIEALWARMTRLPMQARLALAGLIAAAMRRGAGRRAVRGLERSPLRQHLNRDRVRLLENLLRLEDPVEFYRYQVSMWREDRSLVRGVDPHAIPPLEGVALPPSGHLEVPGELASFVDLVTYLPDDVLVKVDRATMAVSLEARAPLLDYRVVELALRTPYPDKIRGGVLKAPLQRLVRQKVDPAIMDRPKMGFGVPIGKWLRGPLRDWADDLLAPGRLASEGYFDVDLVTRRWSEHRSGQRAWGYEIWAVLMFQGWLDHVRGET